MNMENELHHAFEIDITNDKMRATLKQVEKFEGELVLADLIKLVKSYGIKFGMKENILQDVVDGKVSLPVLIAEGRKPIDGKDAYLRPLIVSEDRIKLGQEEGTNQVDFKRVKDIPSVTQGMVVGEKVERTKEENGCNVFGEEIKAKPGRDMKLRAGKNTRVDEEGKKIISLIDGQVSNDLKVIHVYPVYEVNGDVDMSIGNIDFVGNVNIRGNVPTGFTIKANGDVRVRGTVEGALIEAGGSIYIHQGVVAQGKGEINARGDFYTTFVNQGNIKVAGDVHVTQSILHSEIDAQGYVYCNKGRGNIVGGNISAGKGIEVNDAGNEMNTQTFLYVGLSRQIIDNERDYKKELNEAQVELEKLEKLLSVIDQKEKNNSLSTQERVLKLRIKKTMEETINTIENCKDQLMDLHDIFENQHQAKIKIYKNIYPNCVIVFGKYRRRITSKHQYVEFKLENKEISFTSL